VDITELIITRSGETLLHMRVDRAEVCIGSNPTNDVVIPDASVPEAVALMMDRGAGRFRMRDLTAGRLRLNGAELDGEEFDMKAGDVLGIEDFSLALRVRADDDRQHHGKTKALGDADGPGSDDAQIAYDGIEYRLTPRAPFNIGGNEDNDLIVEDPFISAYHARITNQNGRWFIHDLDSTNGTQVNGLKVREAELPTPAKIVVGKVTLDFSASASNTDDDDAFYGMIAKSEKMHRIFAMVKRFAGAKEPVLVVGESGSGKELVARALHDASPRARGPYLALNCGALNPTVVESELFGHEEGAFTGADETKDGAFSATSGGTLFLDEIGELPLDLQPKLLRVLETQTVRRIGGTKEIPVDTRIVAATHRNLEELVEDGRFREDLFHRLFVLSLRVPPLTERPDDILPLTRHFLKTQSPRPLELTSDAEEALRDYTWPGNIRELRNVLVRAILMSDADRIDASDLQFSRDAFTTRSSDVRRKVRRQDEVERDKMLEILDACGGNRAEAARMLGVSKSTFHDRLKRHGIGNKFGDRK
jgi:DNA-binding NtrC family response regulator